ncbi:MAG: biotin/lipoyl-binding protein [Paludisphaera borealis]|uniref:efflux RND transporter periplasmic adaptor subunit n=1 Tax=Paludisphaera borealis TaxID=1387353 RepID=UPI00284C6E5A|nr:biotin/lipoyl-binding protein [Paludisphaera borealis]MDR3618846.1 biotin/lipoyl-binding protein [Paludisphaera borealis]
MTEETIDAGLLEQTKTQIRKLVAEIADLAESDVQPGEFYGEFLNRAVAATAATGGAFWLLDGRGGLRLQYQLDFAQTGLMDGRVKTPPHDALLGCMVQATQPQIVPPGAVIEGVPQAYNPTHLAIILAPLVVDKQVVGLLEILMDPSRRAAQQKSTLRFVADLCDLASNYLKNRQMRQMVSQQRLWNQLEGFTHQIHASLDLKETAYAIVNDGKRLVGCDRLSVAMKLSGRTLVEAISGQEVVEQRSNQVRELTKLCKAVIRSGEDLVYTGNTDGFAPDIRDALELYVDESGSKAVAIAILHKPEKEEGAEHKEKVAYGCLVAEQIGDEIAPTDMHARTEVVSRHASTALWNSQEHHRIFLRPLLKAMGSPWRLLRGRTLAKIVAVLLLVVSLIGALTFVPWNLRIEGRGSLMPEQRQSVYAPIPGIVVEVPVDHGAVVKKGDVIARLDSRELQKELNKLTAEYNKASNQTVILQRQEQRSSTTQNERENVYQLQAQLSEAQITAKSSREQIEIVQEQIESMSIRAPHDGVITTWKAKENLMGRPVDIGTELLQIASTEGEWVLEVDVPDDDMGPVLAAQSKLESAPAGSTLSAYFVVMTEPEHRYQGFVRRIAAKAETKPDSNEQRHTVKVTVGFSDAVRNEYLKRNHEFRAGAETRARIDCGDARLAYVLFRKVVQVWHESVLFRWPFLH